MGWNHNVIKVCKVNSNSSLTSKVSTAVIVITLNIKTFVPILKAHI